MLVWLFTHLLDLLYFTSFVGLTVFVSQQMKTVGVWSNYAPFLVALLLFLQILALKSVGGTFSLLLDQQFQYLTYRKVAPTVLRARSNKRGKVSPTVLGARNCWTNIKSRSTASVKLDANEPTFTDTDKYQIYDDNYSPLLYSVHTAERKQTNKQTNGQTTNGRTNRRYQIYYLPAS